MIGYLTALSESVTIVQEHLAIRNEKNYKRTIFIDDCGIDATNFDIEAGDTRYTQLVESGYKATKAFFETKTEWSQFISLLKEHFGWKE